MHIYGYKAVGLGTLFLFTTDLLQRTIKSTCSTSIRPSANIRQANGVLRLPLNVTFASWSHYLEPRLIGSATTQNKFVRKSRLGHKSSLNQVKTRLPFTSTDAPSLAMWKWLGYGLCLGCSGNSACRQLSFHTEGFREGVSLHVWQNGCSVEVLQQKEHRPGKEWTWIFDKTLDLKLCKVRKAIPFLPTSVLFSEGKFWVLKACKPTFFFYVKLFSDHFSFQWLKGQVNKNN